MNNPCIKVFVSGTQNYDLGLGMICEQMKELLLILGVFLNSGRFVSQ